MPVAHFMEHEIAPEKFTEAKSPVFYKAAHYLVKKVVEAKLDVRYYGLENIPLTGPAIFAPNHDTAWDPPLMGLAVGEVGRPLHFLAKKELWDNRLLGYAMNRLGQIPTDRKNKYDFTPVRAGSDILYSDKLLGVFPDGTREKADLEDYSARREEMKEGVALFSVKTGSWVYATGIDIEKTPVNSKGQPQKINRKRVASVVIAEGIPPDPELKGKQARNEMITRIGVKIAEMHAQAKLLTKISVIELDEK